MIDTRVRINEIVCVEIKKKKRKTYSLRLFNRIKSRRSRCDFNRVYTANCATTIRRIRDDGGMRE